MNTEQAKQLREPFPAEHIGLLPKGGTTLEYVGHGAVTDRLLEVDPDWNWEPLSVDDDGLPRLDQAGNLWIKLTVGGVTRLGVGDGATMKVLIGDALRNAAMRFGVALDLWIRGHAEDDEQRTPEPQRQRAARPPQAPSPARTDQTQSITKPDPNLIRNDAATGDNLAAAAIIKNLTPYELAICKEWWTNNGYPFMSSGAPNPLRLQGDDLAAALDFLHDLDTQNAGTVGSPLQASVAAAVGPRQAGGGDSVSSSRPSPAEPAGAPDPGRDGEETEAVRALANNGLLHPDEEQPLATPSETEAALARSRAHLNKPALGAKR